MPTQKKTAKSPIRQQNGHTNGRQKPQVHYKQTPVKKSANGNGNGKHAIERDPSVFDEQGLLEVLTEVKNGNFAVRMPINQVGIDGKICDTLNDIISLNEKMMQEFTRAGNTIGKQGKLTQRIEVPMQRDRGAQALNRSIRSSPILFTLLSKLRT